MGKGQRFPGDRQKMGALESFALDPTNALKRHEIEKPELQRFATSE